LKDMDLLSKSDPMGVLFQKMDNLYYEVHLNYSFICLYILIVVDWPHRSHQK